MKYIRTKDGIVENTIITNKKMGDWAFLPFIQPVYESDIVEQADTIEELCDEFVAVVENGLHNLIGSELKYRLRNKENNAGILEYLKKLNTKIMGAIWTDDGLKYVAKINDNGELELL